MSKYEIIIQNGSSVYYPVVVDALSWSLDRFGAPGRLTFKVLNSEDLVIEEGNTVSFKKDGVGVFYGFIFKLSAGKETIGITAYDQLRYLKNKDTLVYKNLTADGLVRKIGSEFNLQVGTLANTGYVLPPRIEDNKTLADMIKTALDITLQSANKLYIIFDEYGKIRLAEIEAMRLDLLLEADVLEDFNLDSSIDSSTYNKIKLVRPNEATGKRDVFIAQDGTNINRWGLLQYYDTLKDGETGQAKVDALLKLYNQKNRVFKAKDMLGDVRVRGGSSLVVQLKIGAITLKNYMVVERVTHRFADNEHFMDLELRGGSA